jgi:hypothetical protein
MGNNNRRHFLKASAFLGSSLLLSSTSGFAKATEKVSKQNSAPSAKTRT